MVRDRTYWEQIARMDEKIEAAEAALSWVTLEENHDWRSVPPDDLKSHLFEEVNDRLIPRDIGEARAFLRQVLGSVTVYSQNGISTGVKDVADRVVIQSKPSVEPSH